MKYYFRRIGGIYQIDNKSLLIRFLQCKIDKEKFAFSDAEPSIYPFKHF